MLKKKTLCTLAAVLFFGIYGLWAGDTASFVDLGFSPDGRTYMFAQYGVQSANLRPWADLFVLDVNGNGFVPGGRINYVHNGPITPGQDGSGALFRLIAQNAFLAERHNVDFLAQGRPLFIALDNTPAGSTIEFRDFENNISYRATLVSVTDGFGESLRSSFFIDLERVNRDGTRNFYPIGNPDLRRPLVESYRIRRVMVDPRNSSMVILIEMKQQEGESFSIRYMVEALRL